MSIDSIFPQIPFSQTEEDIVIQCLTNLSVKRYLRRMAMENTKELLAISALSNTSEKISHAHATVIGGLRVIETLLSIEEPTKEVPQS